MEAALATFAILGGIGPAEHRLRAARASVSIR
jgi:hypothetical protein